MSKSPTISIVAGPNGAGKTTFVENFLNRYVDCDEFLNADLIASGLSPFAPERQNLKASEVFLMRLAELEQGNQSFALETTLSGLSYRRRIPIWQQLGFKVMLLFLWLPSADIAVQRVRERVAQGGHNIPEPDIRRRYVRGLRNLTKFYLPLVSNAWVLNASQSPPPAILEMDEVGQQILEPDIWQEILRTGKYKS